MNFITLAAQRCSVRRFDGRPVPRATVETILRAGHLAPTACNLQPQKIYLLTSDAARQKMRECTFSHFDAPLGFLVCYDTQRCWVRGCDGAASGETDAAIVATHMMLAAAEQGVGSTWVMSFDPDATRAAFALPAHICPLCFLPMGYPAPDAVPSPRHTEYRPESEIVEEC